jgi:hypothetical protein
MQHWMANDLRDLTRDTCARASRRGLLDAQSINSLVEAAGQDPGLLHTKLWSVVILELWCQGVLDAATTSQTPTRPAASWSVGHSAPLASMQA